MRSLVEFLLSGHFTPSSYLVLNNPHGRAAESRTRIRQSLATCFVIGSSWSFLPTVPTIYLKTIELLLPIVLAGLSISGGIQAASRLEELTYFNHRDQTSGLATHLCESLIYRQISPSKISLFNSWTSQGFPRAMRYDITQCQCPRPSPRTPLHPHGDLSKILDTN